MRHFFKTSFILATIIFGLAFSQAPAQNNTSGSQPPPQNGTQNQGSQGNPQGSQGNPQGSQGRPSGSGIMGNGTRPQGRSNLPPEQPGITEKLANITDNTLVSLKNILQYLPPVEQDLIADCYKANTDLTRLISPDCFKSNFTETVRKPLSQGYSQALTNNSASNRQGLGCLKKVADQFGNATDNTTTNINSDVNSAVTQQIPFNQATSTFVTTILNILNLRRKYFLTTSNVLANSISSKDSDGNALGFVFTADDQTSIVNAFKVYATFIYNFFSNLNTKVTNVQGMIGKLDNCRPPPPSSKRLLQAPQSSGQSSAPPSGQSSGQSSAQPSGQSSGQSSAPPSGQQSGQSSAQPSGQLSGQSSAQPSGQQSGQSSAQPSGQQSGQSSAQPSGQQGSQQSPQGGNSGNMPMGNNTMFNGTSGSQPGPSGSQSGPSNNRPEGGKSAGKDGRPQTNIPKDIASLKGNITALLSGKTGAWATLLNEINTNLSPDSGYKPNGALINSILQRVSGSNSRVLNIEFSKVKKSNETCQADYLFSCQDGVCSCSDAGCPSTLNGINSISLAQDTASMFNRQRLLQQTNSSQPSGSQSQPSVPQSQPSGSGSQSQPSGSGSQQPPQLASNDIPSTYFICSACLSGKRYNFAEATLQISGKVIDFVDSSGKGLGRQAVAQQNNCAASFKNNDPNGKKDCRGDMSDDCAKGLDNACGATGLYDILVNNPVPASALPTQCDDSLTGYTESDCFQWLLPKIVKATIVFDYKGFLDLPRSIANSINAASTLRYLQTSTSSVKVVATDPVPKTDSAYISPSIASVTNTEISVDSATTISAPSSTDYINNLAQTAQNVKLSENFLSNTFLIFMIAMFALLI